MLGEHVDRNSGVTGHSVSVNTAITDSNEIVDDFKENADLPGTAKLKNSNVLQNLESKLSHLSKSQSQKVEQLLHETEHFFPDIPNITYKIYHDVDVGDTTPLKQDPYRLNLTKQKCLHEEI